MGIIKTWKQRGMWAAGNGKHYFLAMPSERAMVSRKKGA